MKAKLLFIILITISITSSSQSGPAGVGNTASNKLWLKGDGGAFTDLGVTQATNGQQVRQWNDLSGNNNHATQNTAANRPLFKANSANGQPGLRFTGDLFIDGPSPGIAATSSYTYFMAFRDTSMVNGGINDGNGSFILDRTTATNNLVSLKAVTGNLYGFQKRNDAGGGLGGPLSTTTINTNNKIIEMRRVFNTNYQLIYNGNLETTLTAGDGNTTPPNPRIGRHATIAGNGIRGFINEFIIYDFALNTAQTNIVNNYLSSKYNITMAANDFYLGDTPGNGDFDKWVAGIGQVDATNMQITFDPSASQGMGLTNRSGFDNGDFVLCGHNLTTNNNIYTDISVVSGGPVLARWERIWYIDVTNTSTNILTDVVFDLSDGGFTGTPTTATNYVLLYRAVNSGNWTIAATGSSVAGDQVTFANYPFASNANDGFYTIGTLSFSSTLPIELISFDAYLTNGTVALEWQTASELNNDYFTIERSSNGVDFEPIMNVDGAGNSNHIINYFETDYSPLAGTSYYRLRQVDFDGTETFSEMKTIKTYDVLATEMNLYPNPTDGAFHIVLANSGEEEVLVVLRDISGKEFYSKVIITSTNNQIEAIDLIGQLAPGTYIVTASSRNELYSQKLIVK
jgi:hypothetical protein